MSSASLHTAYLSLGSNLGDRTAYLRDALSRLAQLPSTAIIATSSMLETAPWGKLDQPAFLNMATAIATALTPEALLSHLHTIEDALGRQRSDTWGPRTLDIDLLCYDEEVRDTPELTLPHPYMTQRRFVLAPLAEIAPALRVHGRTVAEWLDDLNN